ncbi:MULTISPECIES: hypothetical protein [Photorhabdus]|uniref:Transposase n=2 Tax=Photorhabdus TaxID=29487 RepID=A0ABX0AUZ7_9GAMM|nr:MULTISPECIES: hypothetical protein [Photorhabdus]MCC8373343.1 hypothetical protein [Photorhabdus bodei]MCC8466318.1 hypothetical protein [Photorhabdus bodei]MDB6366174.1 hypothetical protein [Photorhabdus bodei]MDB6370796.1 hypothetical protein [Photorhabdus bodei]NDK96692.1 hypothetical protein [Photorhabdus laumondii subsp. laumondii]
MTGVSECSQQRGNLKDDGYILINKIFLLFTLYLTHIKPSILRRLYG